MKVPPFVLELGMYLEEFVSIFDLYTVSVKVENFLFDPLGISG